MGEGGGAAGSRDASEGWSATGAQTGDVGTRAATARSPSSSFAPRQRGDDDPDGEHREQRRARTRRRLRVHAAWLGASRFRACDRRRPPGRGRTTTEAAAPALDSSTCPTVNVTAKAKTASAASATMARQATQRGARRGRWLVPRSRPPSAAVMPESYWRPRPPRVQRDLRVRGHCERATSWRLMVMRWISLVPSPMQRSGASR